MSVVVMVNDRSKDLTLFACLLHLNFGWDEERRGIGVNNLPHNLQYGSVHVLVRVVGVPMAIWVYRALCMYSCTTNARIITTLHVYPFTALLFSLFSLFCLCS